MSDDLSQLVAQALPSGRVTSVTPHGAPLSSAQTRAAARLMSIFENQPYRLPELFKAMAELNITDLPGARLILGITGAPGSGKSTLTDALIAEFRNKHPDRLIGVIAVDPSSPFTGGAVLGDRVRMMRHATDPFVFVRSLATRGHLGGLTLGVKAVARVMGLIGCDTVIIETVGVGQSEVEVTKVADHVLVILAPGQGDSIQMLKAGLMEIGDAFAINKADRPGAEALYAQLLSALRLTGRPIALASAGEPDLLHEHIIASKPGHEPAEALPLTDHHGRGAVDVFLVSAVDQTGITTLYGRIDELASQRSDTWRQQRQGRIVDEVRDAILEEARHRINEHLSGNGAFGGQVQRILRGDVTVGELAQELIKKTAEES